jgi:glycosidase
MRGFILATLTCVLLHANPVVHKVEPPDWWVGHTINPVRLLIHGAGLQGATLTAPGGMRTANVRVSSSGRYLFADLTIPSGTALGNYSLVVRTAEGSAFAPFRVNAALDNKDRLPGFTSSDVVYLIMPDRFANGDTSNDDPAISKGMYDRQDPRAYHGGDFQGIIDHLPYLKDLGVTAIWMTPIYDNANTWGTYAGARVTDYHGYGAVDYYGVEEHFGTIALLQKLVREAHRLGIKVIQDEVENHVGPHHPWVSDPPTPTWFHGTTAKHLDENWHVWSIADPYAAQMLRTNVVDGWFGNMLPDLDQEDPEVRQYEIQNTLWWLGEAGFDAIRQDTWPYVARDFWHDWMAAIKRQFPTVNVVGEVLDGDPNIVSFFQGGKAHRTLDTLLDAVFDYPVYFKARDAFGSGASLEEIPKMLGHDGLYPNPNLLWSFIGDHDMPRLMNSPKATIAGLKLAFTWMFTTRGVPLLYYGDEIAMKGGDDPDNRRDFPGGWPGDPVNAFLKAGRTKDQDEVFEHVKMLAHLRQSMPVLANGTATNLVLQDQQWAFARQLGDATAVIVLNNDAKQATIAVPLELNFSSPKHSYNLLGAAIDANVAEGKLTVEMPARRSDIFVLER